MVKAKLLIPLTGNSRKFRQDDVEAMKRLGHKPRGAELIDVHVKPKTGQLHKDLAGGEPIPFTKIWLPRVTEAGTQAHRTAEQASKDHVLPSRKQKVKTIDAFGLIQRLQREYEYCKLRIRGDDATTEVCLDKLNELILFMRSMVAPTHRLSFERSSRLKQ